jgi:hypothetical protein
MYVHIYVQIYTYIYIHKYIGSISIERSVIFNIRCIQVSFTTEYLYGVNNTNNYIAYFDSFNHDCHTF